MSGFIPSKTLLLVMVLVVVAGIGMVAWPPAPVPLPMIAPSVTASVAKPAESGPAQRIVALAPHIVELLYAIGAGERLVGATEYADFPEDAKKLPRIGSYAGLQIERILELQPDLVLAWKTGNSAADLARLEQYGLRIVYSDLHQLEDLGKEMRMLGELTATQAAAERLAEQYETRLSVLREHYRGKRPVRVFYELWSRPLTTVAANAWPQQQLHLCGTENPFDKGTDDYPQVGLEQVVVSAPEVIIQPTEHSMTSPDAVNWSAWPLIPAVRLQAILHPDSDKAHRMTPRTLDVLEQMCAEIDQVRQRLP